MSRELMNDILQEVNEIPGNSINKTDMLYKLKARKEKMEIAPRRIMHPETLAVGDVILAPTGFGMHPALVFAVNNDDVLVVTLSSKDKSHNIYQIKHSRFLRDSYVTNQVIRIDTLSAIGEYKGTFDNAKELEKIVSLLQKWYSSNLKIKHARKQTKRKTREAEEAINS